MLGERAWEGVIARGNRWLRGLTASLVSGVAPNNSAQIVHRNRPVAAATPNLVPFMALPQRIPNFSKAAVVDMPPSMA